MIRCVLCFATLLLAGVRWTHAQELAMPEQVRAKLTLVNDRFLKNWPDPAADIVTDRARPSNIWTRATYFEGLMALHKVAPDPRYLSYAVRWAESHDWTVAYGSADPRHADNQCCGQTYLDLYALEPQPVRLAGIKGAVDAMVNSSKSDDWWWIDALQMAMPVFARLGVLTNDPRYFEKMHALYTHTRSVQGGRGLYHPTEHLWWRDADFDPPYKEPNGANCYWSRGNGWVFAALVRVLDVLPADAPHRAEYVRTFQDMAAALLPLQRIDGFWNVSLKDADNYGGPELTGTAFFTYGLAWGVRKGFLSRATHLPMVAKAWHALANFAVRPDGTLGYVQGSGKQPSDGQPVTYDSAPNFDDFGTGAFLLAGSEVHQLTSVPAIDYVGVFKAKLDLSARRDVDPGHWLVARIRGTNLRAAFSASAPQLVLPDGRSLPFLYQETTGEYLRTSFDPVSPNSVDRLYPNGIYTVLLGTTAVRDLNLGFASDGFVGSYPPFNPVDVTNSRSTARPVVVDAGEFDPAPQGQTRVSLKVSGEWPSPSVENLIDARSQLMLILPAFTFTKSFNQLAAHAEVEHISCLQPSVDLGALGSATIEGGFRSQMGSRLFYLFAPDTGEKLVNLSSRGFVGAGGDLTAGFVISPGGPKMVLVRAAGPALQSFGVTNTLANPYLRVTNANRTRAWQNDDWQSTPQYLALDSSGTTTLLASYSNPRDPAAAAREAGAFPLAARSRDAGLVLVLPPGNYTAQVTASGGSAPGTALVEVYELTTTQTSPRLTNLSTRGTVSPADSLTMGFVITGGAKRVLLRAVGPTLASVGVAATATLMDPKLAVFNANGVQLAENDNWSTNPDPAAQVALRASLGAFALPAGSRDAELSLTLDPGAYTVRVSQADGGAGVALAEVYTEPPGY